MLGGILQRVGQKSLAGLFGLEVIGPDRKV
jgi:hypothetical protein